MCTVHVKPFGKDAKTISIFEEIIQTNANKFIFTTWAFNESSTQHQVHLLHSFHEKCTMNIIIEGPHADMKDLEIMSHYFARTGFGQLTQETQSVFIQIKQKCLFAVGSHNYILSHILLIHLEDKCLLPHGFSVEESNRFPNVLFDPRGSLNFYVVGRISYLFHRYHTVQEARISLKPKPNLNYRTGDQQTALNYS
jgi:hypothetical protein